MFKPHDSADWFYTEAVKTIPKSVTHEMLEMGITKNKIFSKSKKMNYQYFRFDPADGKPFELPLQSSYKRDYAAPHDNICKKKAVREIIPHYLWNRIPLNGFDTERLASSEHKFMDDHLVDLSKERQHINLFRQIRNQHFPFVGTVVEKKTVK